MQGIFAKRYADFFQFLKKGRENLPPPPSSYVPVFNSTKIKEKTK